MDIFILIVIVIIFLLSVVIHEVSHGTMANILGDPTAKYAGRLTLNPLKHLDLFGSIIVPGVLILSSIITGGGIILGWAKPVPINPYNFRDQKYGSAKAAIAGPAANIFIALIFGLLIRFLSFETSIFFQNLISIFIFIVWVNLLLAFFNLLPIPPLDGSHILFAFLPSSMDSLKLFLTQYGFFILLFVIFFFFQQFIPLINYLFTLIVGFSFL